MKLNFDVKGRVQPDPFIFRDDDGKLYIYATGHDGVQVYSSESLNGVWKYEGYALQIEGGVEYWAPSVIKLDGVYYMYFSFKKGIEIRQFMHVATSDSPIGPFANEKQIYDRFSIDSHVVRTGAGLFLFYAENDASVERAGTRVFVDKLIDPYTPANICREIVSPSFDEEIYEERGGRPWHTLEGPFWFREGEWQYVMYSGACFENDTYHIGYAAAKSDEDDLTKVDFVKYTDNGKFVPTMFRNEVEEGVGHHSVIKDGGKYYAIYHARDVERGERGEEYVEARTARICELVVNDGKIVARQ